MSRHSAKPTRRLTAGLIGLLFTLGLTVFLSRPASAQVDLGIGYAEVIGLPMVDIREIAAILIRSALGLVGFILVLRILWAGFLLMTHGGNEDARGAAIEEMKSAVIGMVIIMTSVSIARFVIDAVVRASYDFL
ncbi:hypothetical protein AMJ57_05785 [Parcubacteria bacterium SG8_24]|nr:MAG: hypothetical protein AMJ57_05785 [Parcubacteria bacterium SG8_24]